ncbi:hypothetical protein GH714_036997 [Hevea brasiliensis]|uniref:Serine aminopeptidase S33 domain-containing protein n=1 Tax=Hevea brasiliensis TaxID=3981 RepID=A0A6A6KGG7_HEVBR|nr:hypothetical protein GH714_036997 [Hevea brasiliensis]
MSMTRSTHSLQQQIQKPGLQLQRVIVENKHGEKLVGLLHETGSKQLAVVCHGFQSSKERIPMVNLAAAVEKEGISAFRFDFAGNGESEGSFQYGNYRREADDLRAVVQHFHEQNRVIIAVIGIVKYKDVHTVVNISGRFNLKRGIEGRLGKDVLQRIKQNGFIDIKNKKGKFEYRVTEESLMDRLTTDTHAACLSIQPKCRVLTVHGSMDKIVPVEDALEFAKFISNHKLHIIEGADHEYTSHQGELASIVLDFLQENFSLEKNMLKTALKDHVFHSRI